MFFAPLLALAAAAVVSAQDTTNTTSSLDPTDALVLKFASVLEELEADFYSKALGKFKEADFTAAGYIPNAPLQIFTSILDHENAHVAYLAAALKASNDAALSGCTFNFDAVLPDVKTFIAVARLIEQVGVGAYLGGATLIVNKSILSAAASVLTIEARHQTALNVLSGGAAIPEAFDQALTPSQVLSLAGPFISGCDLGIPALLPVSVTSAPAPGQKLTIDRASLTADGLYCQMLYAGRPESLSQPIDNCVVPADLPDGPVYIYVTNSSDAISSDINVQKADQILAGPAIAFIDTKASALSDVVNGKGVSAVVEPSGSSASVTKVGSAMALVAVVFAALF